MSSAAGEWEVRRHGITYEIWLGNYCVARGIYNKVNAHLIKAAPKLRKALESLVFYMQQDGVPYSQLKTEIEKARAALTEAKDWK